MSAVTRESVSADEAFTVLTQLAGRIGERLAGTPAERDGIACLAGRFRVAGLEPCIEPVPVPVWEERGASLVADERDVPALSVCFSGRTGPAGVTGEIVAVGDPMSPADLVGVDLRGNIALIDGRDVQVDYPDYRQSDLLLAAGAIGAIFAAGPRQEGGLPQAYYNFKRALYTPTLPTVIVSHGDAGRLAASSAQATLRVDADVSWSVSANVSAELPGTDLAEETVIVSAHHDCVRFSPGASDNAGGCAVVAELARAFASGPAPRRTIRFIHFGAHEVGLFGSEWWIREHLPEVERIAAVINFDGHGLVGGRDTASLLGNAAWVRLASAALAETGLPLAVRYEASGGVGVDSVNFAALGRNAINFGDGGAPRAHTPSDTLDPLGPAGIEAALRMGAALLRAAADADEPGLTRPAPAAIVAEVQGYCARWGWGITG